MTILPYPDPYVLDCDASAEGVGAVLSQEKDGQEWVIYLSKKFLERNYCVTHKELLTVIMALFQREVLFLVRIVSSEGAEVDPGKVELVRKWPVLWNVMEVQGFIGLCTYYQQIVKGFSQIVTLLHHTMEKGGLSSVD